MFLKIYSPENLIFEGNVNSIKVPGYDKPYVILKNFTPIVTLLSAGEIIYEIDDTKTKSIEIKEGLLEVRENVVTICVEVKSN
ncbi:MAG: F0F1 ATP synthase subunit epsilon [Bacteroidales bacterium]|jgi:F-type H+-transporting ATPase subunit epsilon